MSFASQHSEGSTSFPPAPPSTSIPCVSAAIHSVIFAVHGKIAFFGYAHGSFPVACNVSVKVYPRSLQTIDIDLEVSSVAKVHPGKA